MQLYESKLDHSWSSGGSLPETGETSVKGLKEQPWSHVNLKILVWNLSTLLHFISPIDNFELIKSFNFTPDFKIFYIIT